MNPKVFELAITPDGHAEAGHGILAAFVPAFAESPPLVLAGCDPRHDPGKPIEGLASAAFSFIDGKLGSVAGLRKVVVDNWGRFFHVVTQPPSVAGALPLLEFKRFAGGVGVDAFTKEIGATAEAALEILSAVIEGTALDDPPFTLRQFLENIESHGNLPAPGSIFRAIDAATAKDDLDAVVKILHTDPMISATLINYANAAIFAHIRKTASINEAVVRLGMNQVRRVVFIAEMLTRYQKGACPDFDYKAYWRNAVATGAAMRALIAKYEIPERMADDAFTAGLLSGIGWLAIAETFPALMSDYIGKSRNLDPMTKARLQREIFYGPVTQVTETYLKRFQFPESIHSAITGAPTQEGWLWFDCLASATRVAQSLSPLDCLAIPTNLPVPDACREEWSQWQSLIALSN
jgi:HD-like signal output (HDOD) protein